MECYFNEIIDKSDEIKPYLPLVHTCDGYTFRDVIKTMILNVTKCDTFTDEKLLYTYYGKPTYRTSKETDADSFRYNLPVVMILDYEKIRNSPKRVVALDSGAFVNGLFKDYMSPKMNVEGFMISEDISGASRLVNYFYGSNRNYMNEHVKKDIEHDPLDFEIEAYFELISNKRKSKFDNRKQSIEIQFENPIDLYDSLMCIILPEVFLENQLLSNLLRNNNIMYKKYEQEFQNPNQYYSTLSSLTKEFLNEKEYL